MASRAIARVLLILALIVAAHAFKPISSRSVIEQMLSAAESLSFVLPDFAEVRITQASYLAAAFGQREPGDEADSRFVQHNAATMPAVLGFGQSANPGRTAAPCGTKDVAPTLANARPARVLIARSQSRPNRSKQMMPVDLPEAMPLREALAMAMAPAEIELRLTAMSRLSERAVLRRALFIPVTVRPMLPARRQAKNECETTIIGIPESEGEFSQTTGPNEEFEFEPWDLGASLEAAIEAPTTEAESTTSPRNCQVAPPAPHPLEILPEQ